MQASVGGRSAHPGAFSCGRGHSTRAGAVASGRGQCARPGTGFRSPAASGVPGRPGWSPAAMERPRRRRLSPSARGEGGQKPVQRRGRREDPDGSAPQSSVRASSRAKASWLPREDRTKRMSPRRPTASGSVWASCSTARAAATAISATRAICHP